VASRMPRLPDPLDPLDPHDHALSVIAQLLAVRPPTSNQWVVYIRVLSHRWIRWSL
jgi:hypothetical protein